MEICINDLYDLTLAAFHDDSDSLWDQVFEAENYNDSKMENMFNGILQGNIFFAYFNEGKGKLLTLYTRSAKSDDTVQRTVFWNTPEEQIPLSDQQYHCFEDLKRDGYPHGILHIEF